MAAKPRSSAGCWTCRLRRKKCDELRPICAGCGTLEIDCLYSDEKPEWMDEGEKRKQKADEIKAEIKRKAGWRREKRYAQAIDNGSGDVQMLHEGDAEHGFANLSLNGQPTGESSRGGASGNITDDSSCDSPSQSGLPSLGTTSNGHRSSVTDTPGTSTESEQQEGFPPIVPSLSAPDIQNARDLNVVMTYLDYLFPFLFPLYRPTLGTSGRGWLLVLIMSNNAVYHSVVSAASFFYMVMLAARRPDGHEVCQKQNWEELQLQQEMSLKALQSDVQQISTKGVPGTCIQHAARTMQSIIQLLCFEAAIGGRGDWPIHLSASTELFGEIMEYHGRPKESAEPDGLTRWSRVLGKLTPAFPHTGSPVPFNSEEAAMRFFTAVLLHIDNVVSTATHAPSRLVPYHADLLSPPKIELEGANGYDSQLQRRPSYPLLDLDDFMGVQNWALLYISQISALAGWKAAQTAAGTLSLPDLFHRAGVLEADLRTALACLAARDANLRATRPPPAAPGAAAAGQHCPDHVLIDPFTVTRLWAQAALCYVLLVAQGWNPQNPVVHAAVLEALGLLAALPGPACLRTVAWPLAVVGCLVPRQLEGRMRDLVGAIPGRLEMYGSVAEALAVMEGVWARRDEIEAAGTGGEWDLVRCFGALGRQPFLV